MQELPHAFAVPLAKSRGAPGRLGAQFGNRWSIQLILLSVQFIYVKHTHQDALCARILELSETTDSVFTMVSIIWWVSRAQKRRTSVEFVTELDGEYANVPFFSKIEVAEYREGIAIFFSLRKEILSFLNDEIDASICNSLEWRTVHDFIGILDKFYSPLQYFEHETSRQNQNISPPVKNTDAFLLSAKNLLRCFANRWYFAFSFML